MNRVDPLLSRTLPLRIKKKEKGGTTERSATNAPRGGKKRVSHVNGNYREYAKSTKKRSLSTCGGSRRYVANEVQEKT